MTNLLLFVILLVLFAALFPMCALILGVGGVVTLAEFWDRYWWLVVVLVIGGVALRQLATPFDQLVVKIGGALGRAVRRFRG